MSRSETIQRLQALLERVRTRSTEPRRPPAQAKEDPAAAQVRSPATAIGAASGAAVETGASEEHDSRERLVSAEPALDPTTSVAAAASVVDSLASMDIADIVMTADADIVVTAEIEVAEEEEEEVEPAPASSRRPVAPEPEERLAAMAFGSEEPPQPLHTPPPESGRLPAAPGPQFDLDRDFTGLRDATPLLPRRLEPVAAEILPEAVRPELAESDAVGEVIAHAQRFAPATFVALLDASLAL